VLVMLASIVDVTELLILEISDDIEEAMLRGQIDAPRTLYKLKFPIPPQSSAAVGWKGPEYK
jgi:hypothetical protein